MSSEQPSCPLCGSRGRVTCEHRVPDRHDYDCSACGAFSVTGTARGMLNVALNPELSIGARRHWDRTGERLVLTEYNLDDVKRQFRDVPLETKRRAVLEFARAQSRGVFGAVINLGDPDNWASFACRREELPNVLSLLNPTNYLERSSPNEYFEAGLGKAWGKEVVFTCSNASFKSVGLHFDTSPFKHIVWNDAEDLREKLACRLVNTVPSLTRSFAVGRISP